MNKVLTLLAAGVLTISYQLSAQTTQTPTYPPTQTPQTSQTPETDTTQNPQVYTTNERSGGVIASGTNLQIRTNDAIEATPDTAGRIYSAEIADDVMGDNGSALIPRGSPVQLTVGKISSGTGGVGNNQVALGLKSVSVNGKTYQVVSDPLQQQSSDERGLGKNKRTAEMTGGGALLGTVIGAIAGGGKGAAVGAAVGAAGGATTQVLTRGNKVSVPAETLLTFRLDQPLTLQ